MQTQSYRSKFHALFIISSAPIVALLAFSGVVYYLLHTEKIAPREELISAFQIAVPSSLLFFLVISQAVYKSIINRIGKNLPLDQRFVKYQNAFIVRIGLLEMPGLTGCIATFLTGYLYFLFAPLLAAVVFVFIRPTAFTAAQDLGLSHDERALLSQ